MKKVIISLICAGMLIGSMPLDAAVSKMRAIKCAIPRLHAKFNCTAEEKAAGKRWLGGATVAVAVAALAALVVGGVKLAEVQAEKKRMQEGARIQEEAGRKRGQEQYAAGKEHRYEAVKKELLRGESVQGESVQLDHIAMVLGETETGSKDYKELLKAISNSIAVAPRDVISYLEFQISDTELVRQITRDLEQLKE